MPCSEPTANSTPRHPKYAGMAMAIKGLMLRMTRQMEDPRIGNLKAKGGTGCGRSARAENVSDPKALRRY